MLQAAYILKHAVSDFIYNANNRNERKALMNAVITKNLLTPTTAYIKGSTIANRQWAY